MKEIIMLFILYLIFINIALFCLMYIDKRKAIKNEFRISEKTLSNKLTGRSTFEWEQCFQIKSTFFPNSDIETLFKSKAD